jgi:hypothetical protein
MAWGRVCQEKAPDTFFARVLGVKRTSQALLETESPRPWNGPVSNEISFGFSWMHNRGNKF